MTVFRLLSALRCVSSPSPPPPKASPAASRLADRRQRGVAVGHDQGRRDAQRRRPRRLCVSRLGKPVIAESRLGFLFTDAPQMLRNFKVAGQTTRSFDETGSSRGASIATIRDHYNELTVSFDEKIGCSSGG
jgi:hypothetical protein